MSGYMRNTRIDMWIKLQWSALTQQLEQMEEEILSARKEVQDKLAPSSFSYFLYEKKVEKYRNLWDELKEAQTEQSYGEREKLIQERITEIIKQNNISQEDYPQNERIRERKERHEKICIQWITCLYFNAETPE